MRLADVLETILATETVSIQDSTGVIFYGDCMDFRATTENVDKHLLRKVGLIRAGVPELSIVIGLED